jgi:hypothetical protein
MSPDYDPRPVVDNQFSHSRPVGESRSADPAIQPTAERPQTVLGRGYREVAARSAEERQARAEQRLKEWRQPRQTEEDTRQ